MKRQAAANYALQTMKNFIKVGNRRLHDLLKTLTRNSLTVCRGTATKYPNGQIDHGGDKITTSSIKCKLPFLHVCPGE